MEYLEAFSVVIFIFFVSMNVTFILVNYTFDPDFTPQLKTSILKLRIGFKIIAILFFLPMFVFTYPNVNIPFKKIFYK